MTTAARQVAPAPKRVVPPVSAMSVPVHIQRCGGTQCAPGTCDHDDGDKIHRSVDGTPGPARIPPSVVHVLNTEGRVLDTAVRVDMERRFGHDFGQVRVHSGAEAARSARAIHAHAYTLGRHVVMDEGRYQPHSASGIKLLAHELTHVVQQSRGTTGTAPSAVSSPASVAEREAERVADAVGTDWSPRPPSIDCDARGTLSRQPASSSASSDRGGVDAGSVDAGATDAGPAAGPNCYVDVRATHIGGALAAAPIWHLFVVQGDATGQEWYFRGGPGGACAPGQYGAIKSTHGRYLPGTVDWAPGAPSVTVLKGSAACGKEGCFTSELSRIDGLCRPYSPTGPNSNTVARTLLVNCGVPQAKPVAVAPGWGDPNL